MNTLRLTTIYIYPLFHVEGIPIILSGCFQYFKEIYGKLRADLRPDLS